MFPFSIKCVDGMSDGELSNDILELVDCRPGTSFIELENAYRNSAELKQVTLKLPSNPNIYLWYFTGINPRVLSCFLTLLEQQKLFLMECRHMVYVADGKVLNLPLFTPDSPEGISTWLPVTLSLKETSNTLSWPKI